MLNFLPGRSITCRDTYFRLRNSVIRAIATMHDDLYNFNIIEPNKKISKSDRWPILEEKNKNHMIKAML